MFDHVGIRVSDRAASRSFYETVLSVLGIRLDHAGELYDEWDELSIGAGEHDSRVTRGLHIGFPAASREQVDEFWRVGVDAGYVSDGEPGPRPEYGGDYYGGFLLDPDGNSAEAVHYSDGLRSDGTIDHLWIRVRDVAASKHFYELVAPFGRFELYHDSPDRAGFSAGNASFSVLSGSPTENLHLAFPADDNATVDEFHRTLVEAGYLDNGAPGERPIYHLGYYGAFVLDPDDLNVEVVCHNRG
ncbi:MAG TPA: VOC family protein [Gaiellaceae bacterium]|nr:VOC family protein [Gaiellaceae bacterium]